MNDVTLLADGAVNAGAVVVSKALSRIEMPRAANIRNRRRQGSGRAAASLSRGAR
jgi:hypothetical protein